METNGNFFRFRPLSAAVTDHNKLTACSSSLSSLWCCGYSWSSAEMWQGWVGRWLFLAHRCRLRPPSTAAGLGQSGGYRGRTGEQMQQLSVRHTAAVIRLVLMVFSLSLPAYSQRMENHISPPNFLGQPVPPPASSGRYSPTPKSTLGDDDVTRWEQKHCARARLHWNVSVFL